jgi:hypothetical protein
MLKQITAVFGAAILTASCGILDTDDKGKKAEENAPALAGTWETECVENSALELSRSKREYSFNAVGDFDKTESYYAADDCGNADVVYTVKGTYDDKGNSPDNQDVTMINFTINEALVTVNSDTAIDAMNAVKLCGISDWAVGKETDVTGKDCMGSKVNKGDVIFEVYKLEDDNSDLYFGQNFVFLTETNASERPTDVNRDVLFTRQ